MKNYCLLIVFVFFISCNSIKKNEVEKKEELILHQPSELAILMEEMYSYNEKMKFQIIEGKELTQFPEAFLKIHTAEMTPSFERDTAYITIAKYFISSQKSLFNSDKKNLKADFNSSINMCIACHQTSCTGPIPRIEKLLIK